MIAATLWRCTQNFCGARIMRLVEMRGEIRCAEKVVTVMTYERTRCPILNQVPRRTRCVIVARALCRSSFRRRNSSMKRNELFARIPTDFYLGVRRENWFSHATLPPSRTQQCIRGPRWFALPVAQPGRQKMQRPSFGVIEPENKDAPSPNYPCSRWMEALRCRRLGEIF